MQREGELEGEEGAARRAVGSERCAGHAVPEMVYLGRARAFETRYKAYQLEVEQCACFPIRPVILLLELYPRRASGDVKPTFKNQN